MIPDILRTITKVRAQHFLGERDIYKVKPNRTFTHRNTYRTLLKYIGKDLGMYEERDPEAIDQGENNTRKNMGTLTNDSESSDASSEWS